MLHQARQIAWRGAAESINRLIAIPHDPEAAARAARHEQEQLRRRTVRVLELIHEHRGIPPTDVGQGLGISTQKLDRPLNQSAEVYQPAPSQLSLPHTVCEGPLARLRDLLRRIGAVRRLRLTALPLFAPGSGVGCLGTRFLR